ncbi:hypothetical protein RYH80_18065 [Halobaculum sp. MBLA0147]|uniref:hypothetical protein n=1 Tax=Halobaculum sp. MBLA0147 TaxID=3079934 RepID=UPI0035234C98
MSNAPQQRLNLDEWYEDALTDSTLSQSDTRELADHLVDQAIDVALCNYYDDVMWDAECSAITHAAATANVDMEVQMFVERLPDGVPSPAQTIQGRSLTEQCESLLPVGIARRVSDEPIHILTPEQVAVLTDEQHRRLVKNDITDEFVDEVFARLADGDFDDTLEDIRTQRVRAHDLNADDVRWPDTWETADQ